jgi:hypothetical protein
MLRYRFDPGRQFRKQVERWRAGLKDLRWAWPYVSGAVERHHAGVFDSEGRFDGGWINLSMATAKARFFGWPILGSVTGAYGTSSVEGEEGRILHWTHRLRNSLSQPKHPDAIRQFFTQKMVFGTKAPHAQRLHAGGNTNVGTSIPPRPIIDPEGTQSVVVDAMQKMVDWHFQRGARGLRSPIFK